MNDTKSTETNLTEPGLNTSAPNSSGQKLPQRDPAAKFPGVAAIALWMLLEALIGVMGVFTHHFVSQVSRLSVLAVATLLAVAGLGLLRMKRWGWALALAAVFLTSSYGVYVILRYHQQNYWVMTIVNFIFFFYLVRPEILRRLR
jgi:uncharacterized membrane protein (UPF0136 family)